MDRTSCRREVPRRSKVVRFGNSFFDCQVRRGGTPAATSLFCGRGTSWFGLRRLHLYTNKGTSMKHPYALRGKLRSKRALVLVPFLLGYAVACGDDKPDSGYY